MKLIVREVNSKKLSPFSFGSAKSMNVSSAPISVLVVVNERKREVMHEKVQNGKKGAQGRTGLWKMVHDWNS